VFVLLVLVVLVFVVFELVSGSCEAPEVEFVVLFVLFSVRKHLQPDPDPYLKILFGEVHQHKSSAHFYLRELQFCPTSLQGLNQYTS
jgi:hypothetical protein